MSTETDRIAELEAQLAQSISKAEVVRVSRKYADQHGWCNVVDQALREVGALTPPITVTTTLSVTHNVRLTIDPAVWNAMDEAQQKSHVEDLARRGGLFVNGAFNARDGGVERLEATGRPLSYEAGVDVAVADDGAPAGYVWRYTDNDGRVMHLWSDALDAPETLNGRGPSGYSECSRQTKSRRQPLLTESRRGEDRHCQRCEERAQRLASS